MKHLLILLSFLLLSSPVIGQETGVLYLYETSSGYVYKSFGDGKVQPKYKGEITNGKPNGFGVLTYPYGGKSVVGEWKNGKEWNTKHTKNDGTLIGRLEGKENGQVIFTTFHDGGKYVGEWKNGKQNGQGTETIPNVGKYVGEWRNGKTNGQGTLTFPDGSMYVGELKDDKRWNGTIYDKNGNIKYKLVNGKRIIKNLFWTMKKSVTLQLNI